MPTLFLYHPDFTRTKPFAFYLDSDKFDLFCSATTIGLRFIPQLHLAFTIAIQKLRDTLPTPKNSRSLVFEDYFFTTELEQETVPEIRSQPPVLATSQFRHLCDQNPEIKK